MLDYQSRLACAFDRVLIRLDEGQDLHNAAEEFSRAYTVSPFDLVTLAEHWERKAFADASVAIRRVRSPA